jgi:C_GCAxxG_C_C family probable redox protein
MRSTSLFADGSRDVRGRTDKMSLALRVWVRSHLMEECRMSDADVAVDHFTSGCACSQAILGAFGPRYGLDEAKAMQVAAGFAGGMRLAETCGAVTGAFMALGLAYCNDSCKTIEGRSAVYGAVTSFAGRFKERHGSLVCRDLLGCDISTPEGLRIATEDGLFRTRCVQLVRDAAELVESMVPTA